jgi:hypothetical protein
MRTNHTPQELLALQPDPLEPRAEGVERYVGALQVLAGTDPDLGAAPKLEPDQTRRYTCGSAPRRGPREPEPHLPARHRTETGARRPL